MAPTATGLHNLSVGEAARLIRSGELSPVELLESVLRRIASVDDRLNTYLLVDEDGARASAKRAESEIAAGRWIGPLHGIPYGVKDNYYTRGIRTCANSRVLLDHVPDFDATVVSRLRRAGAVLVGKLNTWEYGTGHGLLYDDTPYPHARNPWREGLFPGGSSTGAGAAVAAGTALFTFGSDTGGSVRGPASACGVQGLKPTHGRVSRYGILPNSWSLDVPGLLAWTVEDCAIVLQEVAGRDPRDPSSAGCRVPNYLHLIEDGVEGLVIGVVKDVGDGIEPDPGVRAGLEDMISALEEDGACIVETALPAPPASFRELSALISTSERATVHEEDFRERGHLMGRELREALMAGSAARAVDYIAALRRRRELAAAVDEVVSRFDALLLPCTHHTAPPLSAAESVRKFVSHSATTAFNISGHPAMSTRTGFDGGGLPTSAQVVGRYFDESTVLRVARSYERARAWHKHRPMGSAESCEERRGF